MIARTVAIILLAVFVAGAIVGYALHKPATIVCQMQTVNGQVYANNCVTKG